MDGNWDVNIKRSLRYALRSRYRQCLKTYQLVYEGHRWLVGTGGGDSAYESGGDARRLA